MASKFKRRYLNSEEKNMFMVSKAFIEMLDGERGFYGRRTEEVWIEWEKRGKRQLYRNLSLNCTGRKDRWSGNWSFVEPGCRYYNAKYSYSNAFCKERYGLRCR